MGLLDYTDFIGHGGDQFLTPLKLLAPGKVDKRDGERHGGEDENESGDEDTEVVCDAILVRVPAEFSRRDILSWPLERFSKFPVHRSRYSCDDWAFDSVEGYGDVLLNLNGDNGEEPDGWWRKAIWKSPTFPDEWLVNFVPGAYDAFVLGRADPGRIPWKYYHSAFGLPGWPLPRTKKAAYSCIRNCSFRNLWEYDGKTLEPLPMPAGLVRARDRLGSSPLFAGEHLYRLAKRPAAISPVRMDILVLDHASANSALYRACRASQTKLVSNPLDGSAIASFVFRPTRSLFVPKELSDGCLECGEKREMGKYTCGDHTETPRMRQEAMARISASAGKIENYILRALAPVAQKGPPATLSLSFTEKGVQYDLVLSRVGPEPHGNIEGGPAAAKIPDDDPIWDELGF